MFSINIIDLESKVNINLINEVSIPIFQQALQMAGADPAEISTISDSFLDWVDIDENPHLSGTESPEYISNPNPGYAPYVAKNGPIDDLSELLLIRGMTPDIFFGPGEGAVALAATSRRPPPMAFLDYPKQPAAPVGLVDLFTPLSAGMININTASAQVLQLIPGIDREPGPGDRSPPAGLDGSEGNEDDMPFRNPNELMNVPGMPPGVVQQASGTVHHPQHDLRNPRRCSHVGQYRRAIHLDVCAPNPATRDVQDLCLLSRPLNGLARRRRFLALTAANTWAHIIFVTGTDTGVGKTLLTALLTALPSSAAGAASGHETVLLRSVGTTSKSSGDAQDRGNSKTR